MHVAVDQPGQQHLVVGEGDRAGRRVVEAGDGGDPAAVGVHGGGPLAVGQDHPAGPHDQAHADASISAAAAHPVQLGAPRRRHPAAGQWQPDGVVAGRYLGLLVADVHRRCIGPRSHRWQPGGLAGAEPHGGVQQGMAGPLDPRRAGPAARFLAGAAEQDPVEGVEGAVGPELDPQVGAVVGARGDDGRLEAQVQRARHRGVDPLDRRRRAVAGGQGDGGGHGVHRQGRPLLDDQPDLGVVAPERPEGRRDQVHGGRTGPAHRELPARAHDRQHRPASGPGAGDDLHDRPHARCGSRARSCSRTHAATGRGRGSSRSEISTVGCPPRTCAASRRITSRSAPTAARGRSC